MFKHLIKILIRNLRKNLLLTLQFSLALIALILFMIEGVNIIRSITLNIGFKVEGLIVGDISGLWDVKDEKGFTESYAVIKAAMDDLQKQSFIESAGYMQYYPYARNYNENFNHTYNSVTADALKTLDLKLVYGEFFTDEDEFSPTTYCMINLASYQEMQKITDEPLGKNMIDLLIQKNRSKVSASLLKAYERSEPVIIKGVFENFQINGRYKLHTNKQFIKQAIYKNTNKFVDNWNEIRDLSDFVIRIKPGENLLESKFKIYNILNSHLVGRDLTIESCSTLEDIQSKEPLAKFYILLFVSLMLILIITVGIYSISKENINKRIREIGIRIAFGGTEKQVSRQLILEYGILSGLSIFFCLIVMIGIGSFKFGSYEVAGAFLIQWLVIYLSISKTIKKATLMRPNVSLHYE